jgi:hypothetical protein
VQIVASAQAAAESIRAGGMSFTAAKAYSLPPENLLTLLIPGFFGDAAHVDYYGRWYWWETCIFIGPAALALAALGVAARGGRGLAILAGIMLLAALGGYTPLFYVLYHGLPGFSDFRAPARFGLLGLLALAALAALGWDRFVGGRLRRKLAAGSLCVLGVALGLGAIWAMNTEAKGPGDFTSIIGALVQTHETMDPPPPTNQAAGFAGEELAVASGITLLAAVLVAAARGKTAAALGALAMAQVIWFAASQRVASDSSTPMPDNWKAEVAAVPAGDRVLINRSLLADSGVRNGFLNVCGTNPLVLNRTARFLAAIQGDDPTMVGLNYPLRLASQLYGVLRCALLMPGDLGGRVYPIDHPLPHLMLVDHCTLAANSEAALAAVMAEGFDPRADVVLEERPDPMPVKSPGGGTVQLTGETTDELEIEADVPAPVVLLITDAYSAGWRAVAMDDSSQKAYRVLPVDCCLRGIALSAGHHHLRVEYLPAGLTAGAWISAISLAGYAICLSRLARPARWMPGRT